jgi:hypothetical protein
MKKYSEMKKIIKIGGLGLLLVFGLTSCKKYLDVNENPNSATSSTPELMLPQALTATAGVVNNYNSMGAQMGGFMANAGGYGGFGSRTTYIYGNGDYQECWNSAYDNLTDYQWIINNTNGVLDYSFYNGAAKIMKAFDFQLLVDTYNDVPYTNAFQEVANLTPTYDDAKLVYDSIYALLDDALATINAGQNDQATNDASNVQDLGSKDVMFGGDMDSWKQLANSIKLRIAIRGKAGGMSFNNNYDPVGFLSDDAIVNPGYQQASGKQNPKYNSWGYLYDGSVANRAWIPTSWVVSFYNGLLDNRGYAVFYGFGGSFPVNQLGVESNDVASAPSSGSWLSSYVANTKNNNMGVLKGYSAGMVIFSLAESDFLQAEAALKGGFGVTGDPADYYYAGLEASYKYLFTENDGSDGSAELFAPPYDNYEALFNDYLASNEGFYLVDYNAATDNDQRMEAILTQSYLALNMVNSDQAWNDFRRTGYPFIVNGSSDPSLSFASVESQSTRPDKLPSRVLYPTSELSYNNSNMPKGIDPFKSLIFWDPN